MGTAINTNLLQMIRHPPHVALFSPWRNFHTWLLRLKAGPVPCCTQMCRVILQVLESSGLSSPCMSVCVCECVNAASDWRVMRWRCQGEHSPLSPLSSLSALYSQCELFIHCSARVIIVTVSQPGLPHTHKHTHADRHTCTPSICVFSVSCKDVNSGDMTVLQALEDN